MKDMKEFVHGTSYEAAKNILKNGFKTKGKKTIWNCSDTNYIYARQIYNEEDYEEEGYVEKDETLSEAIDSALIASAFFDSKNKKIAIIHFFIPSSILEEDPYLVNEDSSCEIDGTVQIDIDELNYYLEKGKIKVTIDFYDDIYKKECRLFYLSWIYKNKHFKLSEVKNLDCAVSKVLTEIDTVAINSLFDYLHNYYDYSNIKTITFAPSDKEVAAS